MARVTRRQFLKTAMLVSASGVWAKPFATASTRSWHERRDLFPEGVASGDPNSNSVLLWTRRAPERLPRPSHLMLVEEGPRTAVRIMDNNCCNSIKIYTCERVRWMLSPGQVQDSDNRSLTYTHPDLLPSRPFRESGKTLGGCAQSSSNLYEHLAWLLCEPFILFG